MIQLKGGHTTRFRVLDRIPQVDPRSFNFPVRRLLSTHKPPRSYTWRCPVWLDQRKEGACVEFAYAHELAARPKVIPVHIVEDIVKHHQIYWPAQQADEWPGGSYEGASPFYEGTSVLAGAKVVVSMGYYQSYAWAPDVDDLMMSVGYTGPAVLGIDWHEGMWDTGPGGYIEPTGAVMGGHAILCPGYNVNRDAFRLHNSWGQGWGDNGGAWIKREHLRQLFINGGEACIPLRLPYKQLVARAERNNANHG